MGKVLYIAEKPSVAQEFAKVLGISGRRRGWIEDEDAVVTWCVGHLITMSYPEAYDPALKKWRLDTLPFIPDTFRYEVIPSAKDQYETVRTLLLRPDIDTIYVCTDSGREGEYIYRLVAQMAGVSGKRQLRVWIDSQTAEEIRRGIREARDESEYDALSDAAYLRAKEDYLMGINFSRLLTLHYGNAIAGMVHAKYTVISVGRVMTCVLGMVVRRENEIRRFVKTPFYRVTADLALPGSSGQEQKAALQTEWRAVAGSRWEGSPKLYKDTGFRSPEDAQEMIRVMKDGQPAPWEMTVCRRETKTEKSRASLLFNLAELQNVCSKTMKISPDRTLQIVQDLYERKLVTYPRTDARVLSSAVAKEISGNIRGLEQIPGVRKFAEDIIRSGAYRSIGKSRYTDDCQITDHYALIPTGQGIGSLGSLSAQHVQVYEKIVRRFLSIFYPPAVYEKTALECEREGEHFFAAVKILKDPGYLKVAGIPKAKSGQAGEGNGQVIGPEISDLLSRLRKGSRISALNFAVREGETTPPRRYTSGSMILAMENAGQLIENEELREQIRGSGIGTSATRAEILKKLVKIGYLSLNAKTQVLTPTLTGELVCAAVGCSIPTLLAPEFTASWEKGLTKVAEGEIPEREYMSKLTEYIRKRTDQVMASDRSADLHQYGAAVKKFYPGGSRQLTVAPAAKKHTTRQRKKNG